METVKDIQEQIERQKEHNQKRQDEIRRRIAQAESAGHGVEKARAELDQAIRTAEAGERLAQAKLQAAQERESAEAEAQETRAQLARDAIEAKQKKAALLAWEKNGGKISDFETAWESMRLDILKAETQKAVTEKSAAFFESL